MNNNICPDCGTENEEQYVYCKNCGTTLKAEQKEAPESPVFKNSPPTAEQYTPYNNYNPSPLSNGYISGIPEIEYRLFIGKNCEKFLPKFEKMEFTGSKISWCWPPAVLGFFFGPLGAALWFFYRKMYKPAWILAVIGAVLSIITGILGLGTTDAYIDALLSSWSTGNFDEFMYALSDTTQTVPMIISNAIDEISTLATCIWAGLCSFNLYKTHAYSKITEYKTFQADPQHYRLGLTYIGGTSGGMLAVGILLMFGIDYIVSFITTIIAALF